MTYQLRILYSAEKLRQRTNAIVTEGRRGRARRVVEKEKIL